MTATDLTTGRGAARPSAAARLWTTLRRRASATSGPVPAPGPAAAPRALPRPAPVLVPTPAREPAPAEPAATVSTDLALLCASVAAFPFGDYAQVRAVAEADPAAGDVAADPAAPGAERLGPRARAALVPAPGTAEAVPVSRYMAYAAEAAWGADGVDLACPHAAARFALAYALDGAERLRGTVPLGDALVADLGADAGDPWSPGPRLSRAMAALARREGTPDDDAVAAWWVTGGDGRPALSDRLVPDWLAERLAEVPAGGEGAPFPLGRGLVALHRGSATYRARYDIRRPEARLAFVFDMVLHLFDTPLRRRLFAPGPLSWLAGRLDDRADAPGRFETLLALHAGLPEAAGETPDAGAVARWFRATACRAFPGLAAFATLPEAAWIAGDTALELVGMARNATGLGQNLGMSARALDAAGIAHRLRDSEARFDEVARPRRDASLRPRRKAMLMHLNADLAPQALCHPLFDRHEDLYAIGYFLWELEALPRAHALALSLVDEVWCPTAFLAEVYARHTDRPVHDVGKAIALPEPAAFDRAELGIPPEASVFLCPFDFHSSVERKNPLAAVAAFSRAFEGDASVRLVVKSTPPVEGHWGDPNGQWPRILAAAEADPRIVLVTDHLSFSRLLGLIAMADALVSAHRAEGFGYMPAYALSLGRPAIATDYGGSRDFVTEATGFPVAWTPRDVGPGETILPVRGAFWADVDMDALAATMRRVVEDREDAARRAVAGQALMRDYYTTDALAARYRARLTAAGVLDPA